MTSLAFMQPWKWLELFVVIETSYQIIADVLEVRFHLQIVKFGKQFDGVLSLIGQSNTDH